jgi:hypothetical protein
MSSKTINAERPAPFLSRACKIRRGRERCETGCPELSAAHGSRRSGAPPFNEHGRIEVRDLLSQLLEIAKMVERAQVIFHDNYEDEEQRNARTPALAQTLEQSAASA